METEKRNKRPRKPDFNEEEEDYIANWCRDYQDVHFGSCAVSPSTIRNDAKRVAHCALKFFVVSFRFSLITTYETPQHLF